MPPFAGEPELLRGDRGDAAQIQRCKAIVSGILLSAGEARGERPADHAAAPSSTTWSTNGAPRPGADFDYDNRDRARPAHGLRLGAASR
jgi:two-component system sensor histidine kinase RegB